LLDGTKLSASSNRPADHIVTASASCQLFLGLSLPSVSSQFT
jgi:hypothetical protein